MLMKFLKHPGSLTLAALRWLGFTIFKDYSAVVPASLPQKFLIRRAFGSFALRMGPIFYWKKRFSRFVDAGPSLRALPCSGLALLRPESGCYSLSHVLQDNLPDNRWGISVTNPRASSGERILVLGSGPRIVDAQILSTTYFHFLLEVVPLALELLGRFRVAIRGRDVADWHTQILDSFCLEWEFAPRLNQRVFRLSSINGGIYPSEASINAVREALGNRFEAPASIPLTAGRRELLWLVRSGSTSKAKERFVVNEQQLIEKLSTEWVVKAVEMGSLPLKDQIALIDRSDIIVGPYGAAFSTLALARKMPQLVVALTGPRRVLWHFKKLCDVLEIPFLTVLVEELDNRNLVVNPDELVQLLGATLRG